MKLTRRKFLKTLCAIPFLPYALPKKKIKDDLSGVLLVPKELESKARELMSSFHIGDLVSLDDDGNLILSNGCDQPIYGVVTGRGTDGSWSVTRVEAEVSRFIRRGHK